MELIDGEPMTNGQIISKPIVSEAFQRLFHPCLSVGAWQIPLIGDLCTTSRGWAYETPRLNA